MSDIDTYARPAMPVVYTDESEARQNPLDREVLASLFQGYELEPLITVGLNALELVTPRTAQNREG